MAPRKRADGENTHPDDEITVRSPPPSTGFHEAVTKSGARRTVSRRKQSQASVDAYMAKLPDPQRSALQRVRDIVRSVAPSATEEISFTVPTFMYHGPLVGFAVVRKHCSFFVRSHALMKTMQKELAPYVAGPGTLRFTHMEPLPTTLLKAIVLARMRENEDAAPGN